jgi:energy-coupling factor transporter transmembrane protein EcfT
MPNNLNRVIKQFFSSEYIYLFIPGSVVLSIIGNAVSTILAKSIGEDISSAIKIIIGAVLIFLFTAWTISKLSNKSTPATDLAKAPPDLHRGLILLVSNEAACRTAIDYHKSTLECCWLICSTQTLAIAQKIKADFPTVIMPEPWVINDVYDPIEFNEAVRKIYQKLPPRWSISDVIADFTGMTAQGSVGMVLVSSFFPNVKFQYTPAELSDGRPTGKSLTPIGITIV